MKKSLQLIIILAIIFNICCKEEYFPEIEDSKKMLSVDGLLTDESNVINVKLMNVKSFDEKSFLPEKGAKLKVKDDIGNEYSFLEKYPGVYESIGFNFGYGRTYTLYIKTKDNKSYKSSPQTLYPKANLETVTSVVKSEIFETYFDNMFRLMYLPGIELSTLLKTDSANLPHFRFSNTILIEYTENIVNYDDPILGTQYFYCWKQYLPNEYFNLSNSGFNVIPEQKHTLAFCPIYNQYFDIIYEEMWSDGPGPPVLLKIYYRYIYLFVITVKKYQLNADVHKYYREINDQLEARNHIFDPISFQVIGNIICEDNLEEPVLGVFEVSSTSIRTYTFTKFLPDNTVKFKEIDTLDIEKLPNKGRSLNTVPSFWIYNY